MGGLLHLAAGAALAALVAVHPAAIVGVLFVLGWLREGAQHRDAGAWIGWLTQPRTRFEPESFRWHRLWEALAWPIGGACAILALELGRFAWR